IKALSNSKIDDIPYPYNIIEQGSPQIRRALSDDLNTPLAITQMHGLYSEYLKGRLEWGEQLIASCAMLGLSLDGNHEEAPSIPFLNANALINARLEARRAKNFAESDRIRDELAAMGIALKDGKDEGGNPVTTWEVKR
ncbi:MAG: CysS/YqeB C-terminal domain-containing protein, partial [Bosea sp. (in: a-proteobacteria)]